MKLGISHIAHFDREGLKRDGDSMVRADGNDDFASLVRIAYQELGSVHRKFYKMDDLCKAAFIGSEALIGASGLTERYSGDRIGIVLANAVSSLDTDRVHQRSVEDPEAYPPSPAVFVYTLPNIAIGEICIRHGITGENAFFIFDGFVPGPLKERVEDLVILDKIDACIAGWLEKDGEDHYTCFYSVEKEDQAVSKALMPHTEANIQKAFDQKAPR